MATARFKQEGGNATCFVKRDVNKGLHRYEMVLLNFTVTRETPNSSTMRSTDWELREINSPPSAASFRQLNVFKKNQTNFRTQSLTASPCCSSLKTQLTLHCHERTNRHALFSP